MDKKQEKIASWSLNRRKMIRTLTSRISRKVADRDIDDLAREVFSRLSRYTDEALLRKPQTYLFRVAADVVNTWRRRMWNRPHLAMEGETLSQRMSERIRKEVSRLPLKQREVLLLYINEGLTCKQIANKRGCSHHTVLRDLSRAYSTLRIELADRI